MIASIYRIFQHRLFCFFLFFNLLLICSSISLYAQSGVDLSNVRVEELTDDQIRLVVNQAEKLGITDEKLEQLALMNGLSPVEWVKFRTRLIAVRKAFQNVSLPKSSAENTGTLVNQGDSALGREKKPLGDYGEIFASLKSRNFASEVFRNTSISFEPNLRIPTPANYTLAADDELQIDVSGYSEASYKLKVTPEGIIRIPLAGPVTVNGLTIEQARRVISRKLAQTIYRAINSGRTRVDVTLSSIRSIKVIVIGEATIPGTYTLSSLATAYHALYACGGPGPNGSYRDIEIIRNNRTVAVIDVYQFLLLGNRLNDIRLRDNDIIKINHYGIRVELKGEVKKPGLFDLLENETFSQVLGYAGGFTDNAYTARVEVFRNTSRERRLISLSEQEFSSAKPQKGDAYIIRKILNRFVNRIRITGAVFRPGDYELKENMQLSQLLKAADGLREDAFLERALVHRLGTDLGPELISVNLRDLISGKTADISLQREDQVVVFSKFDLKEGYYVMIGGEVLNPGMFLYEKDMTLQDLILMAGGFRETASDSRIEIARRIKDSDIGQPNAKTAIIFERDINRNLSDSSLTRFRLEPFDEVEIRPTPGYFVQKNVVIQGEVMFSGKYSLKAKNDRISDLVQRAGGLTPEAYAKGAVLIRSRKFSNAEMNNYRFGQTNLLKQNYLAGTSLAILQNQLQSAYEKTSDNVGIDLQKILDEPGSEPDLLLNDGDTLYIPRLLQTVRVNGEVLYPALVRYDPSMKFRNYIVGAGGYSDRSARKRSYVVYANGSVKGTRSFLFIKNYPRINPGSEIYVPMRRERERLKPVEAVTLSTALATMLAILYNVLRK